MSKTVIADLDGRPAREQFMDDDDDRAPSRDPFDESTMDTIERIGEGDDDDDDLLIERADEREPDEEPEEEPEEPEAEDYDEDLKPYSAKVRDRIMRERRLRTGEVELRQERERELMGERLSRVNAQKWGIEQAAQNIAFQRAQVKAEAAKAIEDGDTNKQVEANEKLATLAAAEQQIAGHKQRIEAELAQVTEAAKNFSQHGAGAGDGTPPLVRGWKQRNAWFDDPRHQDVRVYAMAVDQKLANEGWDKNKPDYYRELDRRISQRFPEVYGNRQAPRPQPRDGRRAPTGGMGSHEAMPPRDRRQPDGRARVQIGTEDYKIMKRFGIDPNSKSALREYAANKREDDLRRQSRGRRR